MLFKDKLTKEKCFPQWQQLFSPVHAHNIFMCDKRLEYFVFLVQTESIANYLLS